jgi:argininosuccinate lyase
MAQIIRERFSKPADEFAAKFVASIDADANLVVQDIHGSIAHAKMLGQQHILTEQEVIGIVAGLEHILKDWETGAFTLEVANEDVHMNVEKRLIDFVGPAIGAKLHTARSRNDQVALDLRLGLGRDGGDRQSIRSRSPATRAEHAETIFPGITHLRTPPIVFGHVPLCYHDQLGRDARGSTPPPRDDISPGGPAPGGAGSTHTDPVARAGVATAESIDAVRDRELRRVRAACSIIHGPPHSRQDLICVVHPEFGFVRLPDELCQLSIIPGKKIPDMIELVRGKAAPSSGHLATFTTLKAHPSATTGTSRQSPPSSAADTARLSLEPRLAIVDSMKVGCDGCSSGQRPQVPRRLARTCPRGMPFRARRVARLMKHCAERPLPRQAEDLEKFSRLPAGTCSTS